MVPIPENKMYQTAVSDTETFYDEKTVASIDPDGSWMKMHAEPEVAEKIAHLETQLAMLR